ncbi:MAG: hypothetical protein GXP26_07440 [Planctomycetes bacterium]|nr:hypothetical protein [Planctomycetota bacterium]
MRSLACLAAVALSLAVDVPTTVASQAAALPTLAAILVPTRAAPPRSVVACSPSCVPVTLPVKLAVSQAVDVQTTAASQAVVQPTLAANLPAELPTRAATLVPILAARRSVAACSPSCVLVTLPAKLAVSQAVDVQTTAASQAVVQPTLAASLPAVALANLKPSKSSGHQP